MFKSKELLQEEIRFWRQTIAIIGNRTHAAEYQRMFRALSSAETQLSNLTQNKHSSFKPMNWSG